MNMLEKRPRGTESYITRGSVVLLECEEGCRDFHLIYRLSVEPRPRLRAEDRVVTSYSVTVEKVRKGGRRVTACLRDFTGDKALAEEFYRLVTRRRLFPEHLTDFYEDYSG